MHRCVLIEISGVCVYVFVFSTLVADSLLCFALIWVGSLQATHEDDDDDDDDDDGDGDGDDDAASDQGKGA